MFLFANQALKYLKSQNWFLILLEFVVVVLGVYLGIFLSNKNDYRLDRKLEVEYIKRIQKEVLRDVDKSVRVLSEISTQHKKMSYIADFLIVNGPFPDDFYLDRSYCSVIIKSHDYGGNIALPVAISELILTGRTSLIKDSKIREEIIQYASEVEVHNLTYQSIMVDRLALGRKHSSLITILYDFDRSVCHFEEIMKSRSFINDFLDNLARYKAYERVMLKLQDRRKSLLDSLHSVVEPYEE